MKGLVHRRRCRTRRVIKGYGRHRWRRGGRVGKVGGGTGGWMLLWLSPASGAPGVRFTGTSTDAIEDVLEWVV